MAQHFGKRSSYISKNIKYEGYHQIVLLIILSFGLGYVFRGIIDAPVDANIFTKVLVFGVLGLPLFAITYYFFKKSKIDQRHFRRGEVGESRAYFALADLPNEYSVFQDVSIGENIGNIDFVVVGPTGVFAVEVKNISGLITATNAEDNLLKNDIPLEKNPLNQTYANAKNVSEALEMLVVPVLVFTGHVDIKFGFKKIKGVHVVGLEWLTKLILENHGSIGQDKIDSAQKKLSRFV